MTDAVNHPPHYNAHPEGIECIDVVDRLPFCQGNAIKYLWRADHKGAVIQDLEKALWYVDRALNGRDAVMGSLVDDDFLKRVISGFAPNVAGAIRAVAVCELGEARELIFSLIHDAQEAARLIPDELMVEHAAAALYAFALRSDAGLAPWSRANPYTASTYRAKARAALTAAMRSRP